MDDLSGLNRAVIANGDPFHSAETTPVEPLSFALLFDSADAKMIPRETTTLVSRTVRPI
jgi:hypothetical protein